MKINLIEDLSKLSNIDQEILAKLFDTLGNYIIQKVYEDRLNNKTETEIDFGFMLLTISNVNSLLKLKVSPDKDFLKDLMELEHGKQPKLKLKIEKNLIQTLIENYKELV